MHTCSYSETSTYGALLGLGPWVLQRQSLKESVPLHCGSTQTAMLALRKGPSRQLTDTVPELPRRSTNYNSTLWQHSTLHLYLPAFGKHSIPWPSGHKEKLLIEDRNKGGFLVGWVFWSILSRARTRIYSVRKWAQHTTAAPTSSLATSASQLLRRTIRIIRLLAYLRLICLEGHYQKTVQSWNPIFWLS